MTFSRKLALCATFTLICIAEHGFAQERTAGSTVETQMTWSALSSSIQGVNSRASLLESRLNQAEACGKLGKIYAPGSSPTGCRDVDLTTNTQFINVLNTLQTLTTANSTNVTNINKATVCGQAGWVYAPGNSKADSNGCVPASSGKDCVMDQAAACTKVGACKVRSRYPFGNSTNNNYLNVPITWKDGETYIWKYTTTSNDYGGAQCQNGVMKYFATAN